MRDDFYKTSIVIPTFNKKSRLELVLESYRHQSEDTSNFEVVIIDDGSTDGTGEMLSKASYGYDLRYFRQNNGGRSNARNTGIKKSRYPLIIFCDDDLLASKNFVKAHINAHTKQQNAVVHGTIYSLPYLKFFKNPSTGELYDDNGTNTANLDSLRKNLIDIEDVRKLDRIDSQKKLTLFEKQIREIFNSNINSLKWLAFTGGNISCSRELLERAGGFDEELDQKWGCEDIELGYRLHMSGADFVYCEEGCNYHITHFRPSFEEDLRFSLERFFVKHPDSIVSNLPRLLLGEVKSAHEYLDICQNKLQ